MPSGWTQDRTGLEIHIPRMPESPKRGVAALEDAQSPPRTEVLYGQGATPIFLALEQTDWHLALQLTQDEPDSLQTWVVSPGTLGTTFSWSVWKRLPLHEACRRQAPVYLVSAMIAAFPQALHKKTEFGQLPLHLAVGCGASPEVVNLLLVSHWTAVSEKDQSGRTPLQVLEDSEVLDVEEHQAVLASLSRSHQTWVVLNQQHVDQLEALQQEHVLGLQAIRCQHDEDLAAEQKQTDELLVQIELLKSNLAMSKQTQVELLGRIEAHEQEGQQLEQFNEQLRQQTEQLRAGQEREVSALFALQELLQQKDAEIHDLREQTSDLQTALQRSTAFHKFTVKNKLDRTGTKIQAVLDSFVDLHDILTNHTTDLSDLLDEIGVQELEPPTKDLKDDPQVEATESVRSEEESDIEDDVSAGQAMVSAAKAASNVLQHR